MKRVAMVMAAAMAVDGMALAVSHAATPMPSDGTIHAVLRTVTQEALTDHDMRRLVTNFDVSDMRHIMKSPSYSQNYGDKLDSRIAEIDKDWRQKYGHAFDIDSAAAMSGGFYSTERGAAGIVLVDVQGITGGRELRLPLVYEDGFWTLSPPHGLTAQRLRENLLGQLSAFHHDSAQWPASEKEAYREVARHVFAAVLDRPAAVASAGPEAKPTVTAYASGPAHRTWWKFWANW